MVNIADNMTLNNALWVDSKRPAVASLLDGEFGGCNRLRGFSLCRIVLCIRAHTVQQIGEHFFCPC